MQLTIACHPLFTTLVAWFWEMFEVKIFRFKDSCLRSGDWHFFRLHDVRIMERHCHRSLTLESFRNDSPNLSLLKWAWPPKKALRTAKAYLTASGSTPQKPSICKATFLSWPPFSMRCLNGWFPPKRKVQRLPHKLEMSPFVTSTW